MDLNKKLEELKPYHLNCNVFDVYSYNGLSMQDLLCQFFTKINECVSLSNNTIDLAKWLVNEGIEIEVVNKLMVMIEDGTIKKLVNDSLFNSLNSKINNINSQVENNTNYLNNLEDQKLDKTGIVTMANMGQDVKEAMTGGSVAVIGNNMVNIGQMTLNIQDDIGEWSKQNFTLNDFGYNTTTSNIDEGMDSRIKSWQMNASSGERFKINGFTFGSSECCVMFINNDGNIISKIGESDWGTPINYEFTCPIGTSKVKMNVWTDNSIKIIEKFNYVGIVNKNEFLIASQLKQTHFNLLDDIRKKLVDYNDIQYTQHDFAYSIEGNKPYLYENGGAGNSNTVLTVKPGDIYKIEMTTISTKSAYTIILTDDNDNVVSSVETINTLSNETFEVDIPQGVFKMYVSFRKGLCSIGKGKIISVNKENSEIPDFYIDHVENKITEINNLENEYGSSGDTLAFITDIHYPDNKMFSFDILNKLIKTTNLNHVVSGGDILRDDSNISTSRVNIRNFMELVKTKLGDKFVTIYGNHDNNSNQSSRFTSNEVYSMYFKNQENKVNFDVDNLNGLYWYIDNPIQKIRYIGLNTFEGTEGVLSVKQMKWLCEIALDLPSEGWYLAFFSHSSISPFKTSNMGEVREILNAIRYQTSYKKLYTDYNNDSYNIDKDFSAKKHSVLFAMAGHDHVDKLESDNGIYYIQSICDARYKDDVSVPVREDVNLQSFDVITINKSSSTINLTRIGAGVNRRFTFINNGN